MKSQCLLQSDPLGPVEPLGPLGPVEPLGPLGPVEHSGGTAGGQCVNAGTFTPPSHHALPSTFKMKNLQM